METHSIDDCKHGTVVRLDAIMQNHSMSNVDHVSQDLHDILQSYYNVARKRFATTCAYRVVFIS